MVYHRGYVFNVWCPIVVYLFRSFENALVHLLIAGGYRVPVSRSWCFAGTSFIRLDTCLRVQGSGFRVQGPGFRVQGSGFRVQGSGFRIQGSVFKSYEVHHQSSIL